MKPISIVVVTLALLCTATSAVAQERAELESIYVKGSKEFPQTLYVVPWKDVKGRNRKDQQLVLHSVFGDLFDPVYTIESAASDSGAREK